MPNKPILMERVGEKVYSKKYRMNMTCVAYRLAKDIDVLFDDGYLFEHASYHKFKTGILVRPSDAPYIYTGDAIGRRALQRCGVWA